MDTNLISVPATVFIEYYNRNIPESFPQVTLKTLEKFRASFPALFKKNDKWIIDKHRKKLMDWLASHREEN